MTSAEVALGRTIFLAWRKSRNDRRSEAEALFFVCHHRFEEAFRFSELEVVEGMQFDRGYLFAYFVIQPRTRWSPRRIDALHPPARFKKLSNLAGAPGRFWKSVVQFVKPLLIHR